MSNRTPVGNQADTINRNTPFVQESLDLARQDAFVTGQGIDWQHYKAVPSPIGQKDRGDYRRSDGVDTITSNGMIYRCVGKFTATMTDNSRNQKNSAGGILDPSQSHLIMPRFYNKATVADGDRIYLAPGDRLYISDPNADCLVSNYQKMDYEPGIDNAPMFPIVKFELPIIDSLNIEYIPNVDYLVTDCGNIRWIAGGRNPGIDPDTGKGRIYTVRYLYKAYWYITSLPKEVRITNVTTGGVRSPERMPYLAIITREFIFHGQNRGDLTNQLKPKDPKRTQLPPVESVNPSNSVISVDMNAIEDDDSNL